MHEPRLTIVMPVFNEERTLYQIIDRVLAACPFAQIIYVDDGSTDGSLAILKSRARPQDLVLEKKMEARDRLYAWDTRTRRGHTSSCRMRISNITRRNFSSCSNGRSGKAGRRSSDRGGSNPAAIRAHQVLHRRHGADMDLQRVLLGTPDGPTQLL